VAPHALRRLAAELATGARIQHEAREGLGELSIVAGAHELSAARRLQHFNERPVPRLDRGHACRHRLQERDAFRLYVVGGHGKNVDRSQEIDLPLPIERAMVAILTREPVFLQLIRKACEVGAMLPAEIARDLEPGGGEILSLSEEAVGIDEVVEPLLRGHPGEVADRDGPAFSLDTLGEALQVDPQRHDGHLRGRD